MNSPDGYGMSDIRFHGAALALAQLPVDLSLAEKVHERERACGFRFPASIVEWYSLRGSVEALEATRYGNADRGGWIVPLSQLGERDPQDPEVPYLGYINLYRAGEGDFSIYALLDGSEDPPVYVDSSYYDSDGVLVPDMFRFKETFSEFVRNWIASSLAEQERDALVPPDTSEPPDAPEGEDGPGDPSR